MSRKAVRRYLRRERCPDWRPGRATRSGMDAHREWIDARIAEGRINASELHRELASRGVRLSYATVRRYLTKRLGRAGKTRPRVNAAKPKPAPPPSPKQLSFDWVRRPEKRTVEAQARLDEIRGASPDLTAALDLADEFAALIRKQSTGTLKEWLSRAEVSPCPEVRHFAEGIRRDESAVNAAMTTRWSNGPVEGHVNRLKTMVRDEPGHRAGEQLAQVLGAAVDVAADVVGVVGLEVRRCHDVPRQDEVAEAGGEPLDLGLDPIRSCPRSSRWGRGSRPRRCAGPAGARDGSKRLGCESSTNGRSGCSPRPTAASEAAISSSVPPRWTVPARAQSGRSPRDRAARAPSRA